MNSVGLTTHGSWFLTVTERTEAGPLRMLVVDDDVALAKAMSRGLSRLGFVVHVAETAAQGVAVLERERIDVVLSDMNLSPPESGDVFLRRAEHLAPDALRIVYSGNRLADSSFAHVSLEKPCSALDVRDAVTRWQRGEFKQR